MLVMLTFVLPILPQPSIQVVSSETGKETSLVKGLLSRDERALKTLYTSYSAALFGIISKIIKQEEVAEDVLQETMIKIWTNIHQYDADKGKLFTWMARLARNKAVDFLRSRGELNTLKNDDLSESTLAVNKLYQIQYNPEIIGVRQLMNALTAEQRTILDLIYFKGYTQVEVAERLKIPVGTIKTRIRLSIKILRSLF
jgi:RNA polymerase sigma factor (sigma-70 family)